jgi:hypothetical protein
MKKSHILFILFAAVMIMNSLGASSQEAKLTREQKKAIRKAELEYNFHVMDSLFNVRKFIIVADYLLGKAGERTTVTQASNFIMVNVAKGIIQTGNTAGISEIPREGTIGIYKIAKNDKSLSFTVEFDINTPLGRFDVLMDVTAGNLVTGTISGISFATVTWEGHLENLERTRVFKGQN